MRISSANEMLETFVDTDEIMSLTCRCLLCRCRLDKFLFLIFFILWNRLSKLKWVNFNPFTFAYNIFFNEENRLNNSDGVNFCNLSYSLQFLFVWEMDKQFELCKFLPSYFCNFFVSFLLEEMDCFVYILCDIGNRCLH